MANQAEAAPVRGLLLIGVAVLIGALFLSKGFDNGGVSVSAEDLAGATATTVADNAGTGTQTNTSDDVLSTGTTVFPPAELPVLVLNGSGVSGAAGAITTNLQNVGYTAALPPSDAVTPADVTVVYYFDDGTTSYQADATAVASALTLQPTQVQVMPADPAATLGNIGTAVVVVVLGTDVANTLPPA